VSHTAAFTLVSLVFSLSICNANCASTQHVDLAIEAEHAALAGDVDLALALYRSAAQDRPPPSLTHERIAELLVLQGDHYVEQGHMALARRNFNEALDLAEQTSTRGSSALRIFNLERDAGAPPCELARLLEAATQTDPSLTQHRELAEYWDACGDHDAMVRAREAAVAHEPDDIILRLAHANALITQGNLPIARDHLDAILQRDPDHPVALTVLAETQRRLGDTDAAVATYEHLIRVAPQSHTALLRYAALREALGDAHGAEQLRARARVVGPVRPGPSPPPRQP